jgi:photosystem II stability/assembly factor-like uncharacterized protein
MVDESNGWAADLDGKLYRTVDGGASWNLLPTPADVQINAYGSAFLDAGNAWLSNYDENSAPALLRTSDGGMTWTPLIDIGLAGIGGMPTFRFSSPSEGLARVDGVGAGNLYIQMYETHDGGASYSLIPLTGPQPEQGLPPGTIHLCNICGDSFYYAPQRMIVVQGDMGTMEQRGKAYLLTSQDNGQSWSQMILPLPDGYEEALVEALQPVFVTNQDGFLPLKLTRLEADGSLTQLGLAVYRTDDGGATWSPSAAQLPPVTNNQTLHFFDTDEALALCEADLCVSHDGAQSWERVTPDIDISSTESRAVFQVNFVDPLTGWIVIGEPEKVLLYKTGDGGAHWTLLNP